MGDDGVTEDDALDELDDEEDLDEPVPPLDWETVSVIAAAMCETDWEPRAMQARLDATVEPRAPATRDRPRTWVYPSKDAIAAELDLPIVRATLALEDEAVAREWLASLVHDAHSAFPIRPALEALERWIYPRTRVAGLAAFHVLRVPTTSPEMRESRWRVPPLATTRELAMWSGISIETLDAFARRRPDRASAAVIAATSADAPDAVATANADRVPDVRVRHYRYRWVRKPRGGYRLLEAPKPRLRAVQRDLLDGILAHIEPHAAAFAFRAGRSVVDFAAQHVGRETVIRLDLASFFASVFESQAFCARPDIPTRSRGASPRSVRIEHLPT